MTTNITYVFDPTGALPDNRILNEPHTITNVGTQAFLIVPEATPFFGKSLSVINSNGNTLIENVDYYLTHKWNNASQQVGSDIYGSITMLSRNAQGTYRINYNTIGGSYVANRANAIQSGILASESAYINVDWSTAPTSFPPTPHNLNTNMIREYPAICEALAMLAAAVKTAQQNVSVNDLAGLPNFWVNSTMMPLLNLMSSINANNDAMGNAIFDLQSKLTEYKQPLDLNHYVFKLGMFTIKFGFYGFTNINIPNRVILPGIAFNRCIVGQCWLSPYDPEQSPITNDTIIVGSPLTDSINVNVSLNSNINIKRKISYLAIGF